MKYARKVATYQLCGGPTKVNGLQLVASSLIVTRRNENPFDLRDNEVFLREMSELIPSLEGVCRVFYNNLIPIKGSKLPYYSDPDYYVRVSVWLGKPGLKTYERLVVGKCGEIYYTADHYHTFVRLTPEDNTP